MRKYLFESCVLYHLTEDRNGKSIRDDFRVPLNAVHDSTTVTKLVRVRKANHIIQKNGFAHRKDMITVQARRQALVNPEKTQRYIVTI